MIFGVWLAPGPSTCAVPSVKLIAGKRWTLRGPLSAPPIMPLAEPLQYEVVHLVELPVGIPRPEVVSPATKNGRQFGDELLHIPPLCRALVSPCTRSRSFFVAFGLGHHCMKWVSPVPPCSLP